MTRYRSALLAACAGALLAAVPAPAAIDLARKPQALKTVPMQYRPLWRWWWPGADVAPKELDAELRTMKRAGFGGVEQVMLRHPNDWWLPAFRANTKHAVETATKLGLRFDATLAPEWPISSKAIDEKTGMQEAIWSATDLVGPSTYTGPPPQVDDNGARSRTLVAVTAAQPVTPGVSNPVGGGDNTPTVLDPKTAVDLTAKVKDGVLTWEVPAGNWKLVATWMRPTGQRPHGDAVTILAAAGEANLPTNLPDLGGELGPLVPDHFSRAAIDATLKDYDQTLFGGDLGAALRRNGGHVFEDSLELTHDTASTPLGGAVQVGRDGCLACNSVFWTPAFLDEFKQRRGYDLTPLLSVVFGAFDLPDGGGTRLKADYDRTIADLLVANHYVPIRRWANRHGLVQRSQGYNLLGTDKTHTSTKLQLPDVESLDFGDTGDAVVPGTPAAAKVIDDYRSIVSAAHVSGARQVTLEAGANLAGEYDMSVDDYKVVADRAYAAGVTTMALHGFAYRLYQDPYQSWPWPGWSAFNFLFAESWDQAHPALASGLWRGLAGYYGRISAVLRNGRPRVDVLTLSTRTAAHAYGTLEVADALRASDYTWDRVDDDTLAELPAARGRRILPRGPAYRALVVDNVAALSAVSAERILEFANAGVPVIVVGDVPKRGVSYQDVKGEDGRVKAAFGALLALGNVRQVKTGKDAVAALRALRVAADLRSGLPIIAQHRRTAGGDVWFLYNDSTKPIAGTLRFAARGAARQIDPWTGAATRLAQRGRRVALALDPGETSIVAFSRKQKPRRVRAAKLGTPVPVKGPWNLSVRTTGPDGDGKVDLQLPELRDWRDISELADASGTGNYVARFDVPRGWLARRHGVLLDLGVVGGFAAVRVNGRRAPLAALADRPREVTRLLKPGVNELQVRVATTVTNVIVARAQSGDSRYAIFAKNAKQPYGLIGPVTVTPLLR